jgi:hypothetical protein
LTREGEAALAVSAVGVDGGVVSLPPDAPEVFVRAASPPPHPETRRISSNPASPPMPAVLDGSILHFGIIRDDQ